MNIEQGELLFEFNELDEDKFNNDGVDERQGYSYLSPQCLKSFA